MEGIIATYHKATEAFTGGLHIAHVDAVSCATPPAGLTCLSPAPTVAS